MELQQPPQIIHAAQLAQRTKPGLVTVPQHVGEILKPKTLAPILEQAGLVAAARTAGIRAHPPRADAAPH